MNEHLRTQQIFYRYLCLRKAVQWLKLYIFADFRIKKACFLFIGCISAISIVLSFQLSPKISASWWSGIFQPQLHQASFDINREHLNHRSIRNASSFMEVLSTFDWKGYESIVEITKSNQTNRGSIQKLNKIQSKLINMLQHFVELEPNVPVNASCKAPPLIPASALKCEGHGNAFQGSLKEAPFPKIGILIQFGFHVDVLEIYLNEVYDIVDRFFIIESTRAHFRTLKKPLVWERVKDQPRFRNFADKIVHFVIDDAEAAGVTQVVGNSSLRPDKKLTWKMEDHQESLRWIKFLQWNKAHLFFSGNDLIGFGDADEIPGRHMLHMVKHCRMKSEAVDFGVWFPYSNIHQAFASDFPVPGHKFTIGVPTFWTFSFAWNYSRTMNKIPARLRGTASKFVLGGIHMSNYGYLPNRLMRDLSCTECAPNSFQVAQIAQIVEKQDLRALETYYRTIDNSMKGRLSNLTTLGNEMTDIAIIPWFYNCNRNRYPVWEERHDARLN